MMMKTNEILLTSEYSESYNTCEYELSREDFLFIQEGVQNKAFYICNLLAGNIELFNVDDNGERIDSCRIDCTILKVFNNGTTYLQIYEKYSGDLYEIEVSQEYIKENIKCIEPPKNKTIPTTIEKIQIILGKSMSDSKKIKEIQKII